MSIYIQASIDNFKIIYNFFLKKRLINNVQIQFQQKKKIQGIFILLNKKIYNVI